MFTDISLVTSDSWVKGWILSNVDMSSANKRQQGGGRSMMIWVGTVEQTIIEPFEDDEGAKLNSVNYCDFFEWYKS